MKSGGATLEEGSPIIGIDFRLPNEPIPDLRESKISKLQFQRLIKVVDFGPE